MISVVILGAGNVATHLFKAFDKAKNIKVNQWYNRHLKSIDVYKNKVSMPKAAKITAIIQNLITTFVSDQPFFSKW